MKIFLFLSFLIEINNRKNDKINNFIKKRENSRVSQFRIRHFAFLFGFIMKIECCFFFIFASSGNTTPN